METKEEPQILTIKPNKATSLALTEAYITSLRALMDAEDENNLAYHCRVLIQDENDFGIILPATLEETKTIDFSLPEQLCIFNPNKTYILKTEIVFPDQLLVTFISQCRIDLEGLTEPEEEYDDEEGDEELEGTEEPSEEDIERVLNLIAPIPVIEQKQMKLEDIAKTLDGEFVKQVLFKPVQKQEAPTPVVVSERLGSVVLSPEKLVLKQRMKSMLKGMIG
jgi:hypothetical protein